jgi:hypothetical protein
LVGSQPKVVGQIILHFGQSHRLRLASLSP